MKLLIVTQAVDTEDPSLGFFVRWIEEFAKHSESIEVVCLKKGKYTLPDNVRVYSLGKEKGISRIKYIWNFYKYIWQLRHDYNTVFVHMNQEYVLLGWKVWRLLGKRIILWRNHKQGSFFTRIAGFLAQSVCYTSPEAFVAQFRNSHKMPVGVDTDFFKPSVNLPHYGSILFLGRLDSVKKVETFIESLASVSLPFHADIYGSPTKADSTYAKQIYKSANTLVRNGVLALYRGITHEQTGELYKSHAIYVNLTPSGSFDKTIVEAMASGCAVVCSNEALRGVLPGVLITKDTSSVISAIEYALRMNDEERTKLSASSRAFVEREHSLRLLAKQLHDILSEK